MTLGQTFLHAVGIGHLTTVSVAVPEQEMRLT